VSCWPSLTGSRPDEPVRTPAWMIAYAFVLALLGGSYASLVFVGQQIALVFALAALAAIIVALALTIWR